MVNLGPLFKFSHPIANSNALKVFTRLFGLFILVLACTSSISTVEANDFESTLKELGNKSRSKIKTAVQKLGELGNPAALPALEALKAKQLAITEEGSLVILNESEDQGRDVLSGEKVDIESLTLRKSRINNVVRRHLSTAIAKLKLVSNNSAVRREAAEELLKGSSSEVVALVEVSFKKEKDDEVRELLSLVLAKKYLEDEDKNKRLESLDTIKKYGRIDFYRSLEALLEKNEQGEFLESDPAIRTGAEKAIAAIKQRQFFVNQIANLFYGLSLGSVLLLAALGLAITFGLMGVINMAHGEMLMIGAYATFVVQNLFVEYLPSFFNWYLIVAIPGSFLASAIVGIILERTVIRHLYGRPLETLLATWGISLVLIQTVRLTFGAQNVEVANPFYLSGGG